MRFKSLHYNRKNLYVKGTKNSGFFHFFQKKFWTEKWKNLFKSLALWIQSVAIVWRHTLLSINYYFLLCNLNKSRYTYKIKPKPPQSQQYRHKIHIKKTSKNNSRPLHTFFQQSHSVYLSLHARQSLVYTKIS